LPQVFDSAVRTINRTDDGREWLTDRQLENLRGQLLRHPNRTLLEANEAVQATLFKVGRCERADGRGRPGGTPDRLSQARE
jgi:hypothetical protein